MQSKLQLWVLGAIAFFSLVAANAAWLFPTVAELDSGTYLLHRTIALNVQNQILSFVGTNKRAIENAADILNQKKIEHKGVVPRLMKENPPIESISLLDNNGKEVTKTHKLLLVTKNDLKDRSRDMLFEEVKKHKVYIGPVLISGISEPIMTIAVPLHPESGFSAILAEINLKFLLDVVRGVEVGENGVTYVVDKDGFIIAHPNSSLVFGRVNTLSRKLIKEALSGNEANTENGNFSYKNELGEKMLSVALPFGLTNWVVVVEQTESSALSASRRVFGVAIISFALEILLLALLIWNYFNLLQSATLINVERNRREAIFNSLSDGVVMYDEASTVHLMNPKAEELLGVKFGQIAGLVIKPELIKSRPELKALVEIMFPALALFSSKPKDIAGSKPAARIMEVHTSHPELKLQIVFTQVMDTQGRITGFLKILHDIARERLLGKLKSEFVSVAAHQLRTPLSAIKWTLKLLLEGDAGPLSNEQTGFLSRGYEINERMIKLVNDLLNAARIEEGRFGYEFKDVDLEKLLDDIYSGYFALAESHSVKLKFEKTSEKIPNVYADPENLSLVVSNLMDNAVKYTPAGGSVTLKLTLQGNYVLIGVSDTGVGIPPTEYKRVFAKFFRASNVLRMETEGTGLGLFIVRNIVRRHGGEISFVSKENEGTTFSFTLPLKKELVPKEEPPPLEEFLTTI